jgi:hypothetical protein
MQTWNGYTFEFFNINISDHSWLLWGTLADASEVNIMVLGIGASYVSLYSDNGISFWSGGELAFQIQDVDDTPVSVNGIFEEIRNEIMDAISNGFA